MSVKDDVDKLFNAFIKYLSTDAYRYASGLEAFIPPTISPSQVTHLTSICEEIFKNEPVQLSVPAPCYVVGDLHGHFLDLLRILKKYGLPPDTTYLFLGDLVDRGSFSLETIMLIMVLKVKFPNNIFLIRGNHEFDDLCLRSGFYQELKQLYPTVDVYQNFSNMFSYIPISAVVAEKTLCIHGGIGPTLYSNRQLLELKRPITDFGDPIIDSVLWSDPVDNIENFEPSSRGSGYFFGASATQEFLNSTKMSRLIRAHECINDGAHHKFDKALITVFSASNYCGLINNLSAVVHITGPDDYEIITQPPLPYLIRPQPPQQGLPRRRGIAQIGSLGSITPLMPPSSPRQPTLVRPALVRTQPMSGKILRASDPLQGTVRARERDRDRDGSSARRRSHMTMSSIGPITRSSPLIDL